MTSNIQQSLIEGLKEAEKLLHHFVQDQQSIEQMEKAISLLVQSFQKGGKIISAGNGGSMCDAIHFAEELSGRFCQDRKSLPAMAISDPGHLSCTANDYGYEHVFSRFIEGLGHSHDLFLGISTSGNSMNIIKGTEAAHQKGMKVIALLGKDGGKLKELVDVPIIVPSYKTERIQEIHIKIIHLFIEGIERNLFPHLYS